MAVRINLLPWRDEVRKKKKNVSTGFLVGGALLGLLLSGLMYFYLTMVKEDLDFAVANVESATTELKKKLAEKEELETLKTKLKNQIASVEELQDRRPVTTHVMEEFSNAVPSKLFIRLFELKDTKVLIEGVAETDAYISELMTNLEKSEWFKTPNLTFINLDDNLPDKVKKFRITTEVVSKKEGEEDGEE